MINSLSASGKRAADGDILRALACFAVVLLHSSGLNSISAAGYNAISRFCVPVFVLLSGRFCLVHKSSVSHYLKKCLRLGLVFLFWSTVYALLDFNSRSSIVAFLSALILGPVHFWYLYAAAALYIAAPMVQIFCIGASKRQLEYFLLIAFVFGCVITAALQTPWFPLLGSVMEKTKAAYGLGFLFFFVCGDYLRRWPPVKSVRQALYLLGTAGLVITFLGAYLLPDSLRELPLSFISPGVVLYSVAVYVLITTSWDSQKTSSSAELVSSCSLGIYLLHPLILENLIGLVCLPAWLPQLAIIPLKAILAFLVAFAVTWIFKQIPGIRRLL